MIREKIVRVLSVTLLAGCVLSFSACCSTHTLRCSPEAVRVDVNVPEHVKFNISQLQYLAPTNIPGGSDFIKFGVIYLSKEELLGSVSKAAVAAYPKLFSTDSNALPLQVCITRSAYTDKTGAGACVPCLTLTIVPLPVNESTEYTIQVKTDKAEIDRMLSRPVTFTSDDVGRMSCFPTGWIPVFDAKGKRTWASTDDVSRKMMLDNCVHAIMTALQRVSGESWTGADIQK